MTPEAQARQVIEERLRAAGWLVQDYARLNLGAAPGVAVREFPTDTGPADAPAAESPARIRDERVERAPAKRRRARKETA